MCECAHAGARVLCDELSPGTSIVVYVRTLTGPLPRHTLTSDTKTVARWCKAWVGPKTRRNEEKTPSRRINVTHYDDKQTYKSYDISYFPNGVTLCGSGGGANTLLCPGVFNDVPEICQTQRYCAAIYVLYIIAYDPVPCNYQWWEDPRIKGACMCVCVCVWMNTRINTLIRDRRCPDRKKF